MESRSGRFPKGAGVASFGGGWKEYHVADGPGLQQIDPDLAPPAAWIGVLGMPGMTAYVGLLDIGQPKAGETVFVSAASGAVGALVCQIAKIQIGRASGRERVCQNVKISVEAD